MRHLHERIEMAIIANHRRRDKARRNHVISAKATAVPDADTRQMRHHTALAFILVKSKTARSHDNACLEHAIFANCHTRVNSHICFKNRTCANRSALHHHAIRADDSVLAYHTLDNRRSMNLCRSSNFRFFKNFTTFHKFLHERHHRMVRTFNRAYKMHIRQEFQATVYAILFVQTRHKEEPRRNARKSTCAHATGISCKPRFCLGVARPERDIMRSRLIERRKSSQFKI